jgi:hypothetical protein
MPKPRFRIRTLMIAVGVAGILFGLCRLIVDLLRQGHPSVLLMVMILAPVPLFLVSTLFFDLIVFVIERVPKWVRVAGGKRPSERD